MKLSRLCLLAFRPLLHVHTTRVRARNSHRGANPIPIERLRGTRWYWQQCQPEEANTAEGFCPDSSMKSHAAKPKQVRLVETEGAKSPLSEGGGTLPIVNVVAWKAVTRDRRPGKVWRKDPITHGSKGRGRKCLKNKLADVCEGQNRPGWPWR